jgi:hypothetical protein
MNAQNEEFLKALNAYCNSSESHGYVNFPDKCHLDLEINRLIEAYRKSWEIDSAEHGQIFKSVGQGLASCLLVYGYRMAIAGWRKRSREPLLSGLLALAVEGFRVDARENLMVLSLLNHSAEEIGIDPVMLLEAAAGYSHPNAAQQFRSFAQRTPKDKAIEAMGYSQQITADGPTYVRNW